MRNSIITTLCFLLFSVILNSSVRAEEVPQTLFFPTESNHIQVMPQSFEYELIDKDRFRIGNIYFDARLFDFKVNPSEDQGRLTLALQWPAGLLSSGEISIRDNAGKSVWTHPIDKNLVRFSRRIIESRRLDIASLEAGILPEKVFRDMQYVPFFQVCVQKSEPPTRISLCSKDFYIKITKGNLTIHSRDSFRQQSFVNINAQDVGPKGMVFLQGSANIIAMRVLLLSGATMDIDTQKREVEFRHVAADTEKGRLYINGMGAEPIAGHKVTHLEDKSWITEIDLQKPIVFIRGAGDIPMKQEFILQDTKIPLVEGQIETAEEAPLFTYAPSVDLILKKNPRVSVQAADDKSSLEDSSEEHLRWTLLELSSGIKNRRTLSVRKGDHEFKAAWDIIRLPRWDASLRVGFPLSLDLSARGWMENRRIGLGIDYQYDMTEWKSGMGSVSTLSVPVYISVPAHWNFINNSWGLLVRPNSYSFKAGSATNLAVGAYAQLALPDDWKVFGQWNSTELTAVAAPLSSDLKIESDIRLKTEFLYAYKKRQFLSWGFDFVSLKTKTESSTGGNSETLSRGGIFAGYKLQF